MKSEIQMSTQQNIRNPYITAVWGDTESGKFQLVDVKTLSLCRETQTLFAERGWRLLGHVHFDGFIPRLSLDVPISESMTEALAQEVLRLVERAIEKVQREFLSADPREGN